MGEGCYQYQTNANTEGGEAKFWAFFDDVIIECPLAKTSRRESFST